MKIERDGFRILLKDGYNPAGIIAFEISKADRQVAIYQDSEDQGISQALDSIQESAQFDADELANGLILLAQMIKEEAK